MDLKGHVAVVTGASRGVGEKIANALEARGMLVASVARSAARFTADVSDQADVARLKTAVEAELGQPTVLINAAGIFGPIALVVDGDTLRDGVVAVFEFDQPRDPAVEPDPAAVLDVAKDEGLPVLKHQ